MQTPETPRRSTSSRARASGSGVDPQHGDQQCRRPGLVTSGLRSRSFECSSLAPRLTGSTYGCHRMVNLMFDLVEVYFYDANSRPWRRVGSRQPSRWQMFDRYHAILRRQSRPMILCPDPKQLRWWIIQSTGPHKVRRRPLSVGWPSLRDRKAGTAGAEFHVISAVGLTTGDRPHVVTIDMNLRGHRAESSSSPRTLAIFHPS